MEQIGIDFNVRADTSQAKQHIGEVVSILDDSNRKINDIRSENKPVPNIFAGSSGGNSGGGQFSGVPDRNAQLLQERIKKLTDTIEKMTDQTAELTRAGDYERAAVLSGGISNLQQAKKNLVAEAEQNTGTDGGAAKAGQFIAQAEHRAANAVTGGDIMGGMSGTLESAGSAGLSKAGGSKGGVLASVAALIAGATIGAVNDVAKMWETKISGVIDADAALNGAGGDATARGRGLFNAAADAAVGQGFSAEEGVALAGEMAKYGAAQEEAVKAAGNIFLAERNGMSRSTALSYAGTAARYTGMDAEKALAFAVGGSDASGLAPGQRDEFLQAVERIMEDGISRGFVKGADEISGNLAIMSKLSGGDPLWQGKEAATKYSQINAGIADATNLGSINDILMYKAARKIGGNPNESYVDTFKRLEQGYSFDFLNEYMNELSAAEGGNEKAVIGRIKQSFNLNWTGAGSLYKMLSGVRKENGRLVYDDAITGTTKPVDEMTGTLAQMGELKEYTSSDMTALKIQETLQKDVATVAQDVSSIKTDLLSGIGSGVDKIARWVMKNTSSAVLDSVMSESSDKDARNKAKNMIANAEFGTEEYKAAMRMQQTISGLPEEQRLSLDSRNGINDIWTGSLVDAEKKLNGLIGNLGSNSGIKAILGNKTFDGTLGDIGIYGNEKALNSIDEIFGSAVGETTGKKKATEYDVKLATGFLMSGNEQLNGINDSARTGLRTKIKEAVADGNIEGKEISDLRAAMLNLIDAIYYNSETVKSVLKDEGIVLTQQP